MLVREDDREGQRVIAVLSAIDRDIRQDHDRIVLNVRMRPLLVVECGPQEIGVNLRERADHLQLVRRRIHDVDPRAFAERLEGQLLQRSRFHGFINLQQGRALLSEPPSSVNAKSNLRSEERTDIVDAISVAKVCRPCSSLPFKIYALKLTECIVAQKHALVQRGERKSSPRAAAQTLKRKFTTSPSCIT